MYTPQVEEFDGPVISALRRAIAEVKQRWLVIGWVTKPLFSRAPPCFRRHVTPLVSAAFAVVSTHQPALKRTFAVVSTRTEKKPNKKNMNCAAIASKRYAALNTKIF
jgi:hypothetical protein